MKAQKDADAEGEWGESRSLYIPCIRPLSSNASSILLHVIELMGFQHFILAGGHRRSERLGPNIGCIYAGQYWDACLEGKRYGQEKV